MARARHLPLIVYIGAALALERIVTAYCIYALVLLSFSREILRKERTVCVIALCIFL